jgi:hypothetical protein
MASHSLFGGHRKQKENDYISPCNVHLQKRCDGYYEDQAWPQDWPVGTTYYTAGHGGTQGRDMANLGANFRANVGTAMIAAALAAGMAGSQALAADVSLAPGKPAGVREAARHGPSLLLIGGAAAVAVVGIVIATQSSSNSVCGAACSAVTPSTAT